MKIVFILERATASLQWPLSQCGLIQSWLCWSRSLRLGINLISIVSDPRFGRQRFALTDVSVTEVDPKYDQLVEGFIIDDEREDKTDADIQ